MKHSHIPVLMALMMGFHIFGSTVHASETIAGQSASLAAYVTVSDGRVEQLKLYLSANNSPLADLSYHFVEEADRLSIDWKLVPAIAGLESTFGKNLPKGTYNAWGWGIPSPRDRGIAFASWETGITTVSEGLKNSYIDKGASTLEQIGRRYASSPTWAPRVHHIMTEIDGFTPKKPAQLTITI